MTRARQRVEVFGTVQGVGFRPFVYRLATLYGLSGFVLNRAGAVEIEVEGARSALDAFVAGLRDATPPLAVVEGVRMIEVPPLGDEAFAIRESLDGESDSLCIPADAATCQACLEELFDPGDRRYRYPFSNCTDCGPRFTIIENVPYDRRQTTMRAFTMCPECQCEYDDPNSRRFHAQPNCCSYCGPRLELSDARTGDPIAEAAARLGEGAILAVKGLGGFHLTVDATSNIAVERLRARKQRPHKPLAVMVANVDAARQLAYFDEEALAHLLDTARPIVLAPKVANSPLARAVAPNGSWVGIMLAYTPLHHLLLADFDGPALVMTSANLSQEPIECQNGSARERLSGLVDGFLCHDRPIECPCDDSVVTGPYVVRRSRGYTPRPIKTLPFARPVLACGAQLKNTFCVAFGDQAFCGPHVGDLGSLRSYQALGRSIHHMLRLLRVEPEVVAHDLHPDYLSTRFAQEFGAPRTVAVQHHHAHAASVMAEHQLEGPVLAVIFDGTGHGSDGQVWGGEFLLCQGSAFERVAHLEYLPLPGGEKAVRQPWRMAMSLLRSGGHASDRIDVDKASKEACAALLESGLCAQTSSVGRLFDAVSALLTGCLESTFEGQAAIALEELVRPGVAEAYAFETGGPWVGLAPMVDKLLWDLREGEDRGLVATRFHNGVAGMITAVCVQQRHLRGLGRVVLSGGVFQNRYLLERSLRLLNAEGFETFVNRQVPCNDGGVALGQAYVAREVTNVSSHTR